MFSDLPCRKKRYRRVTEQRRGRTLEVLLALTGRLNVKQTAGTREATQARHAHARVEKRYENKLPQPEKCWYNVIVDCGVQREVEFRERAPQRDEVVYATMTSIKGRKREMGCYVRFVPNASVAEPEVRKAGEVVDVGQVKVLQRRVAQAQFAEEQETVRLVEH